MAVKAEQACLSAGQCCYQSPLAGGPGAVWPPARTVREGTGMGPKIAIIGGGIGGLTAAVALARKGLAAEVDEQAPVLEGVGAGVGLWADALTAVAPVGLAGKEAAPALQLARQGITRQEGAS